MNDVDRLLADYGRNFPAFERQEALLEQEHLGKFALFCEGELVGVHDTSDEADAAGAGPRRLRGVQDRQTASQIRDARVTALYAPMWIVPSRLPARWWLWRAHIDTGSPVTIAGSRLARHLLEQHIKRTGRPPPYERLRSATGHPLTVAPVDALVRVPLSMPMSAESEPPSRSAVSHAIDMRVYAGIEAESGTGEAGGRTITLKEWGDCDALVPRYRRCPSGGYGSAVWSAG